jgi:hypothetical protein
VVGVGELPGVVGGGADEIAADANGVFLGVEIDAGEPELAVGGAGVGAAGGGDVEVGDGKAFGVDEGADGHEDGLDDEKGNGKDDLGNEDGDAPGAAAGGGNPGGGGRGGFVAPFQATFHPAAEANGARMDKATLPVVAEEYKERSKAVTHYTERGTHRGWLFCMGLVGHLFFTAITSISSKAHGAARAAT